MKENEFLKNVFTFGLFERLVSETSTQQSVATPYPILFIFGLSP